MWFQKLQNVVNQRDDFERRLYNEEDESKLMEKEIEDKKRKIKCA